MSWKSLLCLLALALPTRAEGLVQLSLEGALAQESGAAVELTLDLETAQQPIVLELAVYLAPGTDAPALARWIQSELESAGARSILSVAEPTGRSSPRADLFLPRATRLALRLGRGLQARVTLCRGAPRWLRLLPARELPGACTLEVQVTAQAPASEARTPHQLRFPIAEGAHSSQIAADLFQAAHAAGWSCERPGDDKWQPMRMLDGSTIVGTSLVLLGASDVLLELEL